MPRKATQKKIEVLFESIKIINNAYIKYSVLIKNRPLDPKLSSSCLEEIDELNEIVHSTLKDSPININLDEETREQAIQAYDRLACVFLHESQGSSCFSKKSCTFAFLTLLLHSRVFKLDAFKNKQKHLKNIELIVNYLGSSTFIAAKEANLELSESFLYLIEHSLAHSEFGFAFKYLDCAYIKFHIRYNNYLLRVYQIDLYKRCVTIYPAESNHLAMRILAYAANHKFSIDSLDLSQLNYKVLIDNMAYARENDLLNRLEVKHLKLPSYPQAILRLDPIIGSADYLARITFIQWTSLSPEIESSLNQMLQTHPNLTQFHMIAKNQVCVNSNQIYPSNLIKKLKENKKNFLQSILTFMNLRSESEKLEALFIRFIQQIHYSVLDSQVKHLFYKELLLSKYLTPNLPIPLVATQSNILIADYLYDNQKGFIINNSVESTNTPQIKEDLREHSQFTPDPKAQSIPYLPSQFHSSKLEQNIKWDNTDEELDSTEKVLEAIESLDERSKPDFKKDSINKRQKIG